MITVDQFFTRLTPKLHGTTVNKLSNKYELLEEAAGNFLARLSPPTAIRRARIENALYDKVYNYTAPSDLADEDSVIDIRPIGLRATGDDIEGTFTKEFDQKKYWKDLFAVETLNAVKTLRVAKQLTPHTTLHRADSLTLEGTVTLSGDASGGEIDTLDYVSGNGSIAFDLSGATGTGNIRFDLTYAIDLSDLVSVGALFSWLKFPDADRLNSIQLKWGSSASAYYSKTVTAAHDRAFETNAWMLQRHDWSDATVTGSPDASAIDYLEIILNYDTGAALSNVKVDAITAALGQVWEVLYYSDRLFRDTTGVTYKNVPTAGSDVILLDTDGLVILQYLYLDSAAQQVRGRNMSADRGFVEKKLEGETGLFRLFENKHPSQRIRRSETYYEFDELDGDQS